MGHRTLSFGTRLILGLASLGFLVGLVGQLPLARAASKDGCYYMIPAHSGHFLDVQGGRIGSGVPVIQWYRNWQANQKFKIWHFSAPNDNIVRIKPAADTGMGLMPSRYAAGAPIIIRETLSYLAVDDIANSRATWVEEDYGTYYKYRNTATGLYLDVNGYSYAAGAPLVQWYGTGGLNQEFYLAEAACN